MSVQRRLMIASFDIWTVRSDMFPGLPGLPGQQAPGSIGTAHGGTASADAETLPGSYHCISDSYI